MASDFNPKDNKRKHRFAAKAQFTDKTKGGKKKALPEIKQRNVEVYYDTRRYFSSMSKEDFPPAIVINFDSDLEDINELYLASLPVYEPFVRVSTYDTFTAAETYVTNPDFSLRPLVLNMASDVKPGGGVRSGSMAQEEDLSRRSNLVMTLPAKVYPLLKTQCILSPEVTVIKNRDYELLGNSYSVAVISIPALRKPVLNEEEDNYLNEDDYDIMFAKIEAIFKSALKYGYDSLILGALGCGAFHNPPQQVARIFKTHLDKYACYFKRIGFPILKREGEISINYDTFKEIIG